MTAQACVVITNPTGLHARPAVKLAQLAAGFDANIEVKVGEAGKWVKARSTARVMKLKAAAHSTLHFRAEGAQANDAVSALIAFVQRDFDEHAEQAQQTDTPQAQQQDEQAMPGSVANDAPAIQALSASPGLAHGVTFCLDHPPVRRTVANLAADPDSEAQALRAALAQARDELSKIADSTDQLGKDVIGFQLSLLADDEFLSPVFDEIADGAAASDAWTAVLGREIADYVTAQTDYQRSRSADIKDLSQRVTNAIHGGVDVEDIPVDAVLIMDELTPSQFLSMDWSRVRAIATFGGSAASHTAMLARAQGVPMLVQLACKPDLLVDGTTVIVDADSQCLVLAENAHVMERYAQRFAAQSQRRVRAVRYLGRAMTTRSGDAVRVMVNIDGGEPPADVQPEHCDGIGLTRTEFLFHGTNQLPDEATQLRFYCRLLTWAKGAPVTIRTLDAGADKPIRGLTLADEKNPFLGLRGVRLSLAYPDVLRVQLRALARAASTGSLNVMVPMVTIADEFERVRALLIEEHESLLREGIPAALPALGMMVEVPAAALAIDSFDAAFYSIGSNDLIQYVCAAGRDSAQVSELLDPLHSGVLELIARVAAHGARAGKPVSLCGEMAMRADCIPALLDAGVRTLSVPPKAIGATKAAIADA